MKNSLMELVKKCQKATGIYSKEMENLERAATLEKLGFKKMAQELFDKVELAVRLSEITKLGYIRITEEKIRKFLKDKAERYNKQRKEEKKEQSPNMGTINDFTYISTPSFRDMYIGSWDGRSGNTAFNVSTRPAVSKEIPEEHTKDYNSTQKGTIGKFVWTETKLEDYDAIPPKRVLKTLEQHKKRNIFDYFTIAKMNSFVDPLLLGRVEGCEDRFYVAQWGKDIQLDDVI